MLRPYKSNLFLLIFMLLSAMLLSTGILWAGAAAAEQEARDQHGNFHSWAPQPGAVTIVDFAASWCAPCRHTLPKLQRLADHHPEVRVLVISVDDAEMGRDALVEDLGLKVPVLWDQNHAAAEHYRPQSMPSTFLFDAQGKEVLAYAGSKERDWKKLVQTVESLLKP